MTREEAVRILEEAARKLDYEAMFDEGAIAASEACKMGAEALRELDAKEKQKPMTELISVKDRMPEIGECVLTLDKWGHIRDRELFMFKSGFICFRPDGLVPVKDITHWMPLPEPPKDDDFCSYGERKEGAD